MDESKQQPRPVNRAARVSLAFAVAALFVGSFDRLGAAIGLVAVAFGIWGVLIGEKTETGIPASVFGMVLGVLAVLWAAAAYASR